MTPEQVKAATRSAARIHEFSFADGVHGTGLRDACVLACQEHNVPEEMVNLIWLALYATWNDALDWAGLDTSEAPASNQMVPSPES